MDGIFLNIVKSVKVHMYSINLILNAFKQHEILRKNILVLLLLYVSIKREQFEVVNLKINQKK